VINVSGLVGKTVPYVIGNEAPVSGLDEQRIVALEVAVAAGARARTVKKHHGLALPFIQIVNAVPIGTFSVVTLR
jgi:tagatose-1,6-bisphosphate aldolase non-catalytic subunit AgaZ/GatZ